jgi:AcrR family transcriptional regulator
MADKNPKAWWHFWQCSRCHQAEEPSEKTRTKILEATFQEVHHVGFQAASLQNILKKTKLTKGALYHHFPNKQALGYALVDEVIRGFVETYWIQPLKDCDDPIDALKQTIIQSGQEMTMNDITMGCPLNNLTQEMSGVDEGFRQRLESIYTDWRIAISNTIEQGKHAGKVKETINADQFAIVFIATLEGCIGQAKSAQSMELLYACGQGLMGLLDTLAIES